MIAMRICRGSVTARPQRQGNDSDQANAMRNNLTVILSAAKDLVTPMQILRSFTMFRMTGLQSSGILGHGYYHSVTCLIFIMILAVMIGGCGQKEPQSAADPARTRTMVIAAAPELSDPLQEIKMGLESDDTSLALSFVFGGPDELLRKLDSGAAFDLLLLGPADTVNPWKADLFIEPPAFLAGDPLVLVTSLHSPDSAATLDTLVLGRFGSIAVINDRLPAGALTRRTLWHYPLPDSNRARFVVTATPRQAVDTIAAGRAAVGLIPSSEARRFEGRLRVLDTAFSAEPSDTGRAVPAQMGYYAAIPRSARDTAAARRLLDLLLRPVVLRVFTHYGFSAAADIPAPAPQTHN